VHEVLRVLAARVRSGSEPGARDDGLRVALAIEGGGMRGTISGGMALALHELGLVPAVDGAFDGAVGGAFDAVYGASAGAITAAWLLSSRPEGLRGWTEPAYARTLIRRSGLLRGRPVADVRALIEELYQTTFPMDFASVLAHPVEYHPLATDAATGQSTDLRPFVTNPAELRLALRASAALPLLAGPPVEFAGRRFYDAGVSESVPYRTALAQGATHVLVLRSRRDPLTLPPGRPPSRSLKLVARTALRRESASLRATFLARDTRLAEDDLRLAEYQHPHLLGPAPSDPIPASERVPPSAPAVSEPVRASTPAASGSVPAPESVHISEPASDAPWSVPAGSKPSSVGPPAVYSIRPARDSPEVSRLATNGKLLQAAFEAGRAATHAAFEDCRPNPLAASSPSLTRVVSASSHAPLTPPAPSVKPLQPHPHPLP
jgi:predicted patatin/cPLA2 family phospholipase